MGLLRAQNAPGILRKPPVKGKDAQQATGVPVDMMPAISKGILRGQVAHRGCPHGDAI